MTPAELPDGWFPVGEQEAAGLERELAAELVGQHPLAGVAADCFVRRRDCDDVVFRLRGHRCEFAVVHLTWARESSSSFPLTIFCANHAELVDALRAE